MNTDTIFSISNMTAMAGWLLLTVAPRWKFTRSIVIAGIIPLMLSALYLLLVVLFFGDSEGNFGSLTGVSQLFSNPNVLLAGWVHYLAFDLFVGTWEVSDSQKHQIHHLLVIPCLFLTFMLGPVGLLLYYVIRAIKTKRVLHENFNTPAHTSGT